MGRKKLAIEQLHVAVLHVLLVLLHGAPGVPVGCKADICLSTRSTINRTLYIGFSAEANLKQASPPIVVEMDNHVHRIRHGAEPLRDLILRDPEGEPSHVDTEHAASAPRASAHAAPHVGPRAAWESSKEIVREVAISSSSHAASISSHASHPNNKYEWFTILYQF